MEYTANLGLKLPGPGDDILDETGAPKDMNDNMAVLDEAIGNLEAQMPNPNLLINGGFDIWSRGAEFVVGGGVYTADRWRTSNPVTVRRVANTSPARAQYAMRVENSGISSYMIIRQPLETPVASTERVTLSCWVRGNLPNNVFCANTRPTGATRYTILPDTWTYIEIQRDGAVEGMFNTNSTSDASYWYEIAGCQLEYGDSATPYMPPDLALETLICKRFYLPIVYNDCFTGFVGSSTPVFYAAIPVPTKLRVSPTFKGTATNFLCYIAGTAYAISSLSVGANTENLVRLTINPSVTPPVRTSGVIVFNSLAEIAGLDAEIYG